MTTISSPRTLKVMWVGRPSLSTIGIGTVLWYPLFPQMFTLTVNSVQSGLQCGTTGGAQNPLISMKILLYVSARAPEMQARYVTDETALRRALAEAYAIIDGLRAKIRRMEEDAERRDAEMVQSDVDAKCKDAEIKRKDAEIKRKDAEIAAYKELLKKAGIEVKRLKASEAYHDGAHVPTSKGSLTMRQMQKEIVDERRAASTGRRP